MDDQQKIEQERVAFGSRFYSEEKQIIILTPNSCGGAGKVGGELLWQASQFFIAYVDRDSNELFRVNDRVVWQITDEENKQKTSKFNFQPLRMYKLKVRLSKPADEINSKHFVDLGLDLPNLNHRFMLLEILSDEITDDRLQQVLNAYNTPVFIEDEQVGKLELNKDLDMYEGAISWLSQAVSAYIEGAENAEEKVVQLKYLLDSAEEWDTKLRRFCAEKLTELANDWQQDDDESESESLLPITVESFIDKISLKELNVSDDGEFTAYYDDGDMFWGHIIMAEGNTDGTLKNANIAG